MRYVTKNNPNTIAILNTGSAIDMSAWNDRLAGLIYGWYGGQSGFEALTDIITGKVTPSGKLPMTIEKHLRTHRHGDTYLKGRHSIMNLKMSILSMCMM